FGIVVRGLKEVVLFRAEWADRFVEEQMQRHADAGERRLEFVTDGGDEIGFGGVEETEASDVVEHNGDAKKGVVFVAHGEDAWKIEFFGAFDPERNAFVETVRKKVFAALQGLAGDDLKALGH